MSFIEMYFAVVLGVMTAEIALVVLANISANRSNDDDDEGTAA